MPRSWSALSLLLAGACLILLPHRSVSGSDAAQEVDLCALAQAPQDYAGRLVKIHGVVSFGFEESAFTSSNCYARLWIAIPNERGQVTDKPPAGTRVIFGVSFDQFREWSKAGVLADPSKLPWQIAEAGKPIKIVRNRRWRQFMKLGRDCPTAATLIGRIDHLPGPGFITPDAKHGFVWQSSGYGHLDAYPVRFVVKEVVTIENSKRCKEK